MQQRETNKFELILTTIKNDLNVTKIDLNGLGLVDSDIVRLCEILSQRPNITAVNLSGNKFGPSGVTALAKLSLQKLDLSWITVDLEGCKALGQNSKLKKLRLIGCNIGPQEAKALAQNQSFVTLELAYNVIDSEGAYLISRIASLRELDLTWNAMAPGSIGRLATDNAIVKLTLEKLELDNNDFEQFSQSKSLRHLSLADLLNDDLNLPWEKLKSIPTLENLKISLSIPLSSLQVLADSSINLLADKERLDGDEYHTKVDILNRQSNKMIAIEHKQRKVTGFLAVCSNQPKLFFSRLPSEVLELVANRYAAINKTNHLHVAHQIKRYKKAIQRFSQNLEEGLELIEATKFDCVTLESLKSEEGGAIDMLKNIIKTLPKDMSGTTRDLSIKAAIFVLLGFKKSSAKAITILNDSFLIRNFPKYVHTLIHNLKHKDNPGLIAKISAATILEQVPLPDYSLGTKLSARANRFFGWNVYPNELDFSGEKSDVGKFIEALETIKEAVNRAIGLDDLKAIINDIPDNGLLKDVKKKLMECPDIKGLELAESARPSFNKRK